MTKTVRKMILDSLRTASVVLDQEIQELVKDIDNDSEFKYHLQVIEDIFKRNYEKTKLHIRWIDEDEETPFDPPYTIEEAK